MGEALHDVDFQQLKIENAQFLETIEARNQELIQLKLASGNTLQVLNIYKVRPTPEPGTLPGFLHPPAPPQGGPCAHKRLAQTIGVSCCPLTSLDLAKLGLIKSPECSHSPNCPLVPPGCLFLLKTYVCALIPP